MFHDNFFEAKLHNMQRGCKDVRVEKRALLKYISCSLFVLSAAEALLLNNLTSLGNGVSMCYASCYSVQVSRSRV